MTILPTQFFATAVDRTDWDPESFGAHTQFTPSFLKRPFFGLH